MSTPKPASNSLTIGLDMLLPALAWGILNSQWRKAIALATYAATFLESGEAAIVNRVIWPIIEKDLLYVVKYCNTTGFD